jgi:hypothetical protein
MKQERQRKFLKIAREKGSYVRMKDFDTRVEYNSYIRWFRNHIKKINKEEKQIARRDFDPRDIPWWDKVPRSARELFKRVYSEAMICKSSYQAKLAQECLVKLAPQIFGDSKDNTLFRPEDYAASLSIPSVAGIEQLVKTLQSLVKQYGAIDEETLALVTREFVDAEENGRSEKK